MSEAAAAPQIRSDGTVLGFDVGMRRIGVAVDADAFRELFLQRIAGLP